MNASSTVLSRALAGAHQVNIPQRPATPLVTARTIWISDIHLGYRDCKADYLLDFLNRIHCDTLYLVGDIVDLWSLKRRFCWPQKHYQIILKLYELAAGDIRVIYVPGNHDEPLRRFCGHHFGPIEIQHEHEYLSADGKRFLIMHGDAMDAYINKSWLRFITIYKPVGKPFTQVDGKALFFAGRFNQKQYKRSEGCDSYLPTRMFS